MGRRHSGGRDHGADWPPVVCFRFWIPTCFTLSLKPGSAEGWTPSLRWTSTRSRTRTGAVSGVGARLWAPGCPSSVQLLGWMNNKFGRKISHFRNLRRARPHALLFGGGGVRRAQLRRVCTSGSALPPPHAVPGPPQTPRVLCLSGGPVRPPPPLTALGRLRRCHRFPRACGNTGPGPRSRRRCAGVETHSSDALVSVRRGCFFQPQVKRDAAESPKTDHREDGLPKLVVRARHSPAHGGQHAQPAGHRGARAARPELVAPEDGLRGLQEQQHRW